jgi:TonB family protein
MTQAQGEFNQYTFDKSRVEKSFVLESNQVFFQTNFSHLTMKTIVLLAIASLCVWTVATAQTPPYLSQIENGAMIFEESPTLESIDELSAVGENNNAWFPDLKSYVRTNLRYPGAARESGTEGVVHVVATVNADGKLTNIQITEGLSYSCDKEVVRLLSEMPSWKPAHRNGKPIDQKIYLRVRFKLKPF